MPEIRFRRYIKPAFIAVTVANFALFSSAIPIFKQIPILTYMILLLGSAYFWKSVLYASDETTNNEKIND